MVSRQIWQISLYPCFLARSIMLAKKTVKTQVTLPKAVVTRFAGVECFDVSPDGLCTILRTVQPSHAGEVRTRLAELGIAAQDVPNAVAWARKNE
jgi:hypothetical protein